MMKLKQFISIVTLLIIAIGVNSHGKLENVNSSYTDNPLKIEKIIGLSPEPSTFRSISTSGWRVDAGEKQGLAISSDGTIYIGDAAESQIDMFSKDREYIKSFGSLGSGNGLFQQISSLAFDDKDQLYVLDSYLANVQVFNQDGTFIKKWGEKGILPNQLMTPIDLCILKSGEVLIADYIQGLKVFSPDGKYLREFSDDENLKPINSIIVEDIEIDAFGSIFVFFENKEKENKSILRFDSNGKFISSAFELIPEEAGENISFNLMSIDGNYLYIFCNSKEDTIRQYLILPDSQEQLKFIDNIVKASDSRWETLNQTDFLSPNALVCRNGNVYYLDGLIYRLIIVTNKKEYLGTIQSTVMYTRYLYERIEKKQFPLGYLRNPQGVRIDSNQRIMVGNNGYDFVSIFDSNGLPIANVGKMQEEYDRVNLGELSGPTDIAFDEDENIFVTNTYSDSIQVFNKNYTPISTIKQSFSSPQGIALDANGRMLVVNSKSNILSVLENNSSKPKYKSSEKLTIEGEWPVGIDVDKDNNMVISSTNTNVIQIMDPDGETIKTIGEEGKKPGQLSGPQGVLVDSNNDIYVVETDNGRIQKFSADGTLLWCSELNWMGLTFITQDKDGLLYVTDCIHGVVLVIRDSTAVPPKAKVKREIPPSGDFAISQKSNVKFKVGDKITLQIKVGNLSKVEFLQLSLLYPEQNFIYKTSRLGTELKSKKFQLFPVVNSGQKIVITSNSLGGSNYNLSGTLLEIDFEVKASGTALFMLDEMTLKNASGKEFKPKSTKDLSITVE